MEENSQNELLSVTKLIEEQPLADRAKSFEQLYEKLLKELQDSDADG